MFQNISFSFLCALAFISWSVLCYLHFIEEHQKIDDYNVEIYTGNKCDCSRRTQNKFFLISVPENSYFTESPPYYPYVSTHPYLMVRAYELFVGYGIVLVVTVLLSKLLQFIEVETITYLARIGENKSKKSLSQLQYAEIIDRKEVNASVLHVQDFCQDNKVLKELLIDLQVRCQELLEELCSANDDKNCGPWEVASDPSKSSISNSSCGDLTIQDTDTDMDLLWKQPYNLRSSELSVKQRSSRLGSPSMKQMGQTVYVTHSHIHINFNAPVTLSPPNPNSMARSTRLHRGSEFLQVWSKYITDTNERPMLTGFNNFLL